MGVQIIRKALGGLAHNIDVHAVGARADHTAQARCTEIQVAIEPVVDLFRLVADCLKLRRQIGVIQLLGQPSLVFTHHLIPFQFVKLYLGFPLQREFIGIHV